MSLIQVEDSSNVLHHALPQKTLAKASVFCYAGFMESRVGYEPGLEGTTRLEIEHHGNFDVIFNPSAKGDFRNYTVSIINFLKEQHSDKIFFFYPNREDAKFFIKKRRNADANDIEIIKDNDYIVDDIYGFNKRGMYAFNSLSHEINIAPRIDEIVRSKEVQDLFTSKGFKKLVLVSPISGIVDRNTKNKYMVYDSLLAKRGLGSTYVSGEESFELVEELRRIFIRNHIEPNDLNASQVLVDKDDPRVVYLIDIEGYTPLKY